MHSSPLLSLCMIVKNEEAMLPRCLKSVSGLVDEIIIVDTGSTDSTREIGKNLTPGYLTVPGMIISAMPVTFLWPRLQASGYLCWMPMKCWSLKVETR